MSGHPAVRAGTGAATLDPHASHDLHREQHREPHRLVYRINEWRVAVAMSRPSVAGAICLVAAAPLAFIGTLVAPTLSDKAADQVDALTNHRGSMILGQTLSNIGLVLIIAGAIWLAFRIGRASPKLALTGGILAVFGSLVVLFEAGIQASWASIVAGLDASNATTAIDRITNSAAVAGLQPISLLGDIGLLVLAIGAVRIGLPQWAAGCLGVGALIEGVGFATAVKAVVAIGFVLVFVGAVMAVRAAATTAPGAESPKPTAALAH
jgi:hypothetical protein